MGEAHVRKPTVSLGCVGRHPAWDGSSLGLLIILGLNGKGGLLSAIVEICDKLFGHLFTSENQRSIELLQRALLEGVKLLTLKLTIEFVKRSS